MSGVSKTPISLSSKPPSLFGNSFASPSLTPISVSNPDVPENPVKQKRGGRKKNRKKKKKKAESDDEGGDFMPVSCPTSPGSDTNAPRLIVSSANLQSKKDGFKFSKKATESEPVETAASPPATTETKPVIVSLEEEIVKTDVWVPDENASAAGSIEFEVRKDKTDESSSMDETEDEIDDNEALDIVISRRLFELPCTQGLIDSFKASVKSNVIKELRGMLKKEPTTEFVLEIADSIDLLKLMGASDAMLDDIGRKACEGATLYKEGMEAVTEGQDLLRSALSDISSLK